MLWIGVCEAVSVASIGGVFGGCLMALSTKANNKWSVEKMEEYWRDAHWQLRCAIELAHHNIAELNQKISTLSVTKPVGNDSKFSNNKGYKHQRQFNQKG